MVDVSNKQKSAVVTVTSSNGNTIVTANADSAQYWSKQAQAFANQSDESSKEAKLWANKLGDTVDGIEYSAKHYAELANSYVEGFEEVVTDKTNNIIATGNETLTEIEASRVDAVDSINTVKNESIATVENKANEANELVNAGIANINTTKNDSLQEIETKADDVIADIEENGKSLPMFTPLWTDHIYNDASYLRADTFSWQNADIYVTGYEIIEREYNNENCVTKTENGVTYKLSPNGFKIADASQNDTIANLYESGKSWFYIIDTENRKFKLPREKSNEHKYLYFYVGNYSRPDSEINLGIRAELANSQDLEGVLASINEVKDNGIAELEATTASGVASVTATTNAGTKNVTDATASGLSSLESKISTGTQSIEGLTTTGTQSVNNATATGLSSIQSLIDSGVSSITNTTNTGVETVNTTATDAKNAIQAIVDAGIPVATLQTAGIVRPDGETITILNGIISAAGGGGGGWEFAKGTNSGYLKYTDSGIMIQWGKSSVTTSYGYGEATCTFAQAFTTIPTVTFSVSINNTSSTNIAAPNTTITKTNFVCKIGAGNGVQVHWIAVGY